jgi:Pyridoxamine 5'-phosphate oxidase
MAKFYSELDDKLCDFINSQKIFFTATAPTEGRINLSPKGMDTFRCCGSNRVAYLDLTGSGNETAAHLYRNERITVMFCSFSDRPLILRLYGRGEVVLPDTAKWRGIWESNDFPDYPGKRQLIVVEIESVQTSCGYGVPMFELPQERQTLVEWAKHKGVDEVRKYQLQNNQITIDGLDTYPLPNPVSEAPQNEDR